MLKYMNIKNSKFTHGSRVFGPSIEARITPVQKRILFWDGYGQPPSQSPCHDEKQIPTGGTLAYDLDLEMNHSTYRLTITGGVIQKAFKPYAIKLRDQGKSIKDAKTRITAFTGPGGKSFLRFEEGVSSEISF